MKRPWKNGLMKEEPVISNNGSFTAHLPAKMPSPLARSSNQGNSRLSLLGKEIDTQTCNDAESIKVKYSLFKQAFGSDSETPVAATPSIALIQQIGNNTTPTGTS
jgi:hypothetical protein